MSDFAVKGGPGASVAVLHEGKIVYSRGIGSANLEYDVPITRHTIFHVASVSKQFTAFAVAMLAEQGKLGLEEDIRTYLPEMPDFGPKITVNHLIHHTSGLRDQWELLVLAGWRPDDVITEEQILKLVYNQRELDFDPGAEFRYSNTNYTLLAKIIEYVSGEKFKDWTKAHIFVPLGMVHTFFYDNHELIVHDRAYSYYEAEGEYRKKVLSYSNVGATSLFTTAEDLMKWSNNFETLEVGTEAVIKLAHTTMQLNNGENIDYAFGQELQTYKGLEYVVHGGADAGYRSFLARFPDQRFAVAVLSNLASFNTKEPAMQIVDLCLEHVLEQHRRLMAFYGQYRLNRDIVIDIGPNRRGLQAKIFGKQDVHHLVERSDGSFDISTLNATIAFLRDTKGAVTGITFEKEGKRLVGNKLTGATEKGDSVKIDKPYIKVSPRLLRPLEGQYKINGPMAVKVWLESDTLRARVTGRTTVHTLYPLSESKFDALSLNGTFYFRRDAKGKVSGLTFEKDGKSQEAVKVEVNVFAPVELSQYEGRYYSQELMTFYDLIVEDGLLLARHQRHRDIPLEVRDRDFFTTDWYIREVIVSRDRDSTISGLKITTNRARDLWFKKVPETF